MLCNIPSHVNLFLLKPGLHPRSNEATPSKQLSFTEQKCKPILQSSMPVKKKNKKNNEYKIYSLHKNNSVLKI